MCGSRVERERRCRRVLITRGDGGGVGRRQYTAAKKGRTSECVFVSVKRMRGEKCIAQQAAEARTAAALAVRLFSPEYPKFNF